MVPYAYHCLRVGRHNEARTASPAEAARPSHLGPRRTPREFAYLCGKRGGPVNLPSPVSMPRPDHGRTGR